MYEANHHSIVFIQIFSFSGFEMEDKLWKFSSRGSIPRIVYSHRKFRDMECKIGSPVGYCVYWTGKG
jgi:hypothetical protein